MNAIKDKDRQATKPKLGMRLFRAKHLREAQRKRDAEQHLQSIPSGELEDRTDAPNTNKKDGAKDLGTRELSNGATTTQQQQQVSTPKRGKAAIKSPTSRSPQKEPGAAADGGGKAASSPKFARRVTNESGSGHSRKNSEQSNSTAGTSASGRTSATSNSRAMTPTAKQMSDRRLRSSPKQQRPSSAGPSVQGGGAGPKSVRSPPSILHRHTHFGSPTNAAASQPPPNYDMSPLPVYHNPRVRFMSSGNESCASTETSQVHLMAGAAGSVASSSAMSSSEGKDRENVFDRVLNMVMAEEHERLNAMGMSRADPKSDAMRLSHVKKAHEKKRERFVKADAKAKAVVAAVDSHSGSDDDLGLAPPNRMDLAPIDIDTGLEIGGSYDAPIDMDTGLEVHHKSPIDMDTGLEIEYHDLNDDNAEEERWKRLNEKGLSSGMESLNLDKERRCRSYDCSRQPEDASHNRASSHGSDPDKYHRSNSGFAQANWSPFGGGRGDKGDKSTKKSPIRKGANKKTKKFWDKSKDFQSDEWVAFDNQGPGRKSKEGDRTRPASSPGRVNDLATF